jgi:hypothetical protein
LEEKSKVGKGHLGDYAKIEDALWGLHPKVNTMPHQRGWQLKNWYAN